MEVLIIIIAVFISFLIGIQFGKIGLFKSSKNSTDEEDTKEKQRQYEKLKKSFNELMNYDYDTAVRRDKYE